MGALRRDLFAVDFPCGRLNGFSDADCDDLLQEVMAKLVVELPKFDYEKIRSRGASGITLLRYAIVAR